MGTGDEAAGSEGIAASIAAARDRHRPTFLARLATIEAAVGQAAAGTLGPAARQDAVRAAHDLAGSLDTFGIGGSGAARRLEVLLGDTPPEAVDREQLERELSVLRRVLA